jgi:hypothetical protein
MIVLAHAGHWIVQLLYLTPLIVLLVALAVGKMKERKQRREGGGAPDSEDDDWSV